MAGIGFGRHRRRWLAALPAIGLLLALGAGWALSRNTGTDLRRAAPFAAAGPDRFVTGDLPQQRYGLLLCGIDHTRALADVILYACFDLGENRAWLLQIPRDLYVDPGSVTGKINEVCGGFFDGDPTGEIARILESQLGLPVDGAAAITLAGVRALVDAVGGVEIDLEQPIDYLPGKTIPAGHQRLNGEHAEWLLRCRTGYRMGDLDRLAVQRQFLFAAFDAARKLDRLEALSIAAANLGHIKTDIPVSELASLVERALALSPDRISIDRIPVYGAENGRYSVLCTDRYQLAALLNAGIRSDDPVDPWELLLVFPPERQQPDPGQPDPETDPPVDFGWDFPDDGDPPAE